MARRGVSILDLVRLFGLTDRAPPPRWARALEGLSVALEEPVVSGTVIRYPGALTGASDLFGIDMKGWPVQAPGLQTGLPVTVTLGREPAPEFDPQAQNIDLEAVPSVLSVDISLHDVSIKIPRLRAARRVNGSGVRATRLLPLPEVSDQDVRLVGSTGVRIRWDDAAGWRARFIDRPDAVDPLVPTGFLAALRFDPPNFFPGGTATGITAGQVRIDDSDTRTAPDIVARGRTERWRGLHIEEATVFLPPDTPGVGDLSVGVSDLLIAFPESEGGVQGEAHLAFGRDADSPETLSFVQTVEESTFGLAQTPVSALSGRAFTVGLANAQTPGATEAADRRPAQIGASGPEEVRWTLPDGDTVDARETPPFTVEPGDEITVRAKEAPGPGDAEPLFYPATTFEFVETDDAPPLPPRIDLILDPATTYEGVLDLSGAAETLVDVRFRAFFAAGEPPEAGEDLRWGLYPAQTPGVPPSGALAQARGREIGWPETPPEPGIYHLILKDGKKRTRRMRIDIMERGLLWISASGARVIVQRDTGGRILLPARVRGDFDALTYHRTASLLFYRGKGETALDPASPVGVTLPPPGAIAEAFYSGAEAPEFPPMPDFVKRVLLMETDTTDPIGWLGEDNRPDPLGVDRSRAAIAKELAAWIDRYEPVAQGERRFFTVGHTSPEGKDPINYLLGLQRAAEGRILLEMALEELGIAFAPEELLRSRNEGSDRLEGEPSGTLGATIAATPQAPQLTTPDGPARLGMLGIDDPEDHWIGADTRSAPFIRERNVSFLMTGVRLKKPDIVTGMSTRRMLIAGDDPEAREPAPAGGGERPYRVRLSAVWDSPAVLDAADWLPTLFEGSVSWRAKGVPPPKETKAEDSVLLMPEADAGATEPVEYTVRLRVSHDRQTGTTGVFGSLENTAEDGLRRIKAGADDAGARAINTLAATLGIGPALLSGTREASGTGKAARIGALAAIAVAGGIFARNGSIAIRKVAFEKISAMPSPLEPGDTPDIYRATVDYAVSFDFDAENFLGLRTTEPIRLAYRNVGVEIRPDIFAENEGVDRWDAVSLAYEDAEFDLESPGSWQIDGLLGNLLQITDVRTGRGSTWIELDLEFALDLGVVEITNATVRLTFGGGVEVELRGLGVKVSVPGVMEGAGTLSIGSGGALKAALDLDVKALRARAAGELVLEPQPEGFTAAVIGLEGRVATPIPLAATGLGLYGFSGRFVAHALRNVDRDERDVVRRELDWFARPTGLSGPNAKYAPRRDQWVLGLGLVTGTLPDAGVSFNAEGMVAVAFPEIEVLLGIEANFLEAPRSAPREVRDTAERAALTGLIAIGQRDVTVAVEGSKDIPGVLELRIPVGGYFPYPSTPGDFFIRIGSDGEGGRSGTPVRMKVLPGSLDIEAGCYLMFEENELLDLGGTGLDFRGFSVGFGAFWEIDYGAGPFRLTATAEFNVGVGLRPRCLAGQVRVEGSLDLGPVGVGASGFLEASICDAGDAGIAYRIEGKFCGRVRIWPVTIKGCLDAKWDNEGDVSTPDPPSPLKSFILADRRGRTIREAQTPEAGGAQVVADAPVWPDTVPMLSFAPAPAIVKTEQFVVEDGVARENWSGSTERRVAYRVDDIRLTEVGGQGSLPDTLPAGWVAPSHRAPSPSGTRPPPSADEGHALALMTRDPVPWIHNLGDGADPDSPGHPADWIPELCEPVAVAAQACVYGGLLGGNGPGGQSGASVTRPEPPYAERWRMTAMQGVGGRPYGASRAAAQAAGFGVRPAARVALSGGPADTADPAITVADGLALARVAGENLTIMSFGWQARPEVDLFDPRLRLRIARNRGGEYCVSGPRTFDDERIAPGLRIGGMGFVPLDPGAGPLIWRRFGAGPDAEIGFPHSGMRVRWSLPAGDAVLTFAGGGGAPLTVTGHDATGTEIARTEIVNIEAEPKLALTAPGMMEIRIVGGHGETALARICLDTAQPVAGDSWALGLGDDLAAAIDPDGPVVTGVDTEDRPLRWWIDPAGPGDDPAELHYSPPEDAGDRSWKLVRVSPMLGVAVTVVSLCGVSGRARRAEEAARKAREEMRDRISDPADTPDAPDGSFPDPEARPLLRPGARYRLEVDWRAHVWTPGDGETGPPPEPPSDDAAWGPQTTERFEFDIAERAARTGMALGSADHVDEREFRPQDVSRYLEGLEPGNPHHVHFLEDPVFAHFRVAYPRQLLEAYGHDLRIALRRSDPPPGSGPPPADPAAPDTGPSPLIRPERVQSGPLALDRLAPPLKALETAIREAPCLPPTRPGGGASVGFTAPLEPRAGYDFMLLAPPQGDPENDRFLIGRAHFRTSRFTGPAALIRDLGLSLEDANPVPPRDMVIMAAPPADTRGPEDFAMEAALRDMGLDPWPIPQGGRITPLWMRSGTQWRLNAILLEADEPLERRATVLEDGLLEFGDRLRVAGVSIGGTRLRRARVNVARTRILYVADGPVDPGGGLTVDFAQRGEDPGVAGGGATRPTLTGRCALRVVPFAALVEGLT